MTEEKIETKLDWYFAGDGGSLRADATEGAYKIEKTNEGYQGIFDPWPINLGVFKDIISVIKTAEQHNSGEITV